MPARIELGTRITSELKIGLSKLAFERLTPAVPLEMREGATLESARRIDADKGDFQESACHYYTVFETTESPEGKAEALAGLSQQLINLGRFGQAARFLVKLPEVYLQLDERKLVYYEARLYEKFGWIADYEGDFTESISRFTTARTYMERIPEHERTEGERSLYSTATHFLGRGLLGLALTLKNHEESQKAVAEAIEFFNEDLQRYERLREDGRPQPAGEAFQHGWLARCFISVEELDNAEEEIEKAGELFKEDRLFHPGGERWGGIAHYNLLKGGLNMKRNNFTEAREEFESALEIRLTKERYPKGESDAMAGIAASYWAEGKLGAAAYYAFRAFKTYPFFLIRPSI